MLGLVITLLAAAPEVGVAPSNDADHRLDLQLVPVSVQMNTVDREHAGTLMRATWRFNRLFGVFVGGGYNWFNRPSPSMDAIYDVQRVEVGWPSTAQMTWSAFAGIETIPLSGELRVGSLLSGRFGLAIAVGAGPAGARVRLKPETIRVADGSTSPATWGFTNVRPAGHASIAWRLEFGAFTVSLGVRGTMWNDATTTVNDCNVTDLRAMDQKVRAGESPTTATVTPGCGVPEQNDIPLALNVVRVPNDKLTVNLAGEFAIGWSFF